MDETQRLTTLVNDLLNLSRIESGKFPMEKRPYDICEQLRRVIISFGARIDEKNIEVEVDMPDESVYVNADQNRINQVLSNLVDNAIKFMPAENGFLRLSLVPNGNKVICRVADNGSGIPPEELSRIFDRFYKVDKAHTSGMGTGLGLAIVKTILDLHDAPISAKSGDYGTEFEFSLEAAAAPKREEAKQV